MNPKKKGKKVSIKKIKKGGNYHFTCSIKVQKEIMEVWEEITSVVLLSPSTSPTTLFERPDTIWLILLTPNQIGLAPNCICESTELPLMKMKLGFSDFCTKSHTQVHFCHYRTQHHLLHKCSHPCTLVGISATT